MADKKVKIVTYENQGKGNTFNADTGKWEVDLADYVDGNTITIQDGKLHAEGGAGFDCEAIGALPERAWKKGTTILARQDGECVQLSALDSIFQEIGVGIAADKTAGFQNDEYNVVVTVTNTGEGKNELTNLVIVRPQLGNYETKDFEVSKRGADEVERVDDFNYNIKGLAKGGTVIVKFKVVGKSVGTLQFSATVDANSALDQNAKNNTATLILSVNTKKDPNFIPDKDCEEVVVTEVDSGIQLPLATTGGVLVRGGMGSGLVVIKGVNTLQGARFQITGAEIIAVANRHGTNNQGAPVDIAGVKVLARAVAKYIIQPHYSLSARSYYPNVTYKNNEFFYESNPDSDSIVTPMAAVPGVDYTFEDGVLEIISDFQQMQIGFKKTDKCRWQFINIASEVNPLEVEESDVAVTTLSGEAELLIGNGMSTTLREFERLYILDKGDRSINAVPNSTVVTGFDDMYYVEQDKTGCKDGEGCILTSSTVFKAKNKYFKGRVIKVKAGTAWKGKWTGDINVGVATGSVIVNPTEKTIEVLATAKPNTINLGAITVIIEE